MTVFGGLTTLLGGRGSGTRAAPHRASPGADRDRDHHRRPHRGGRCPRGPRTDLLDREPYIAAVLVIAAFTLPLIGQPLPIRPIRLLRLAGYLAYDLMVSGVKVSRETVRYGSRTTAGIVAVPQQTRSALVTAAVVGRRIARAGHLRAVDRPPS